MNEKQYVQISQLKQISQFIISQLIKISQTLHSHMYSSEI